MEIAEIAQKNARVKFWRDSLRSGALEDSQKQSMLLLLQTYQQLLSKAVDEGNISEPELASLRDLERKLEQFSELSRLESGKSSLIPK